MCGIAGILTRDPNVDAGRVLGLMKRALQHRGPDSDGVYCARHGGWTLGLAHTRLAILDLSDAGRQPMPDAANQRQITYNGEVYNFRELRAELEALGYSFRSMTDTEVVLQAFAHWGTGAFDKLRGMYAFAVWDNSGRLVLVRDPLGIKPLYFYRDAGLLVFASEVRALLATGLIQRKLSPDGVQSFLRSGSVEAPLTIIEDVRSLRPGEWMSVEPRGAELHVQQGAQAAAPADWPQVPGFQAPRSRAEAIERVRTLLDDSVRRHMVSDVPLGIFLSGGIDSSALVALASQSTRDACKTFSISFAEEEFSEAGYARCVAEAYSTHHHEIRLGESDLLGMLGQAFHAMDQPTIDGMNTYVISKAVRDAGVKVVLSGLGGDELFAGYPSFRRARKLRMLRRIPASVRRLASTAGRSVWKGSVSNTKFWELIEGPGSARSAYAISRRLFSDQECGELQPAGNPARETLFGDPCKDTVNAVSICEIQGYMANTLLRDTDCMSMAHSLEIRVPFVDSVFVSAILGLPGAWKLSSCRPKPLLVDALGGRIPELIWKRPKMGFTLPFRTWMQSALRPAVNETFSDAGSLARL